MKSRVPCKTTQSVDLGTLILPLLTSDLWGVVSSFNFLDLVNSLVVQWLGLGDFTAVGLGSIPGWKLRSCKPCQAAKNKRKNSGFSLSKINKGVKKRDFTLLLCVYVCPSLCNPIDCSPSGSLSMEFSGQGYWSSLQFATPRYLLDPGIEPTSLAFAGRFFTTVPPGKPIILLLCPVLFIYLIKKSLLEYS